VDLGRRLGADWAGPGGRAAGLAEPTASADACARDVNSNIDTGTADTHAHINAGYGPNWTGIAVGVTHRGSSQRRRDTGK
jgi:hypothetical protein